MAHTKSAGSTQNNRDSKPKYLGVKLFGGHKAKIGSILVRQRGTKIMPGLGVKRGKDDTLYAVREGTVEFTTKRKVKFDGNRTYRKVVNVV